MRTTDMTWYKTADLAEQQEFRQWLRSHLALGEVDITFIKKDGVERSMCCTTNPSMIIEYVKKTDREKKPNEDICAAFDVEKQEWRSFRFDSIKCVEFSIA